MGIDGNTQEQMMCEIGWRLVITLIMASKFFFWASTLQMTKVIISIF